MSQFFDSRCNGRQDGGREPRVFKDIPDGIARGPSRKEVLAQKANKERRQRRKEKKKEERQAKVQRRVWASDVE
jgi:hypothetical protein